MRRKGMTFEAIGAAQKPPLSARRIHVIVTTYQEKGHDVTFERLQRKDMSAAYDPKIIKKVLKHWPKDGRCKISHLAKKLNVPASAVYQIVRDQNLLYVKETHCQKIKTSDLEHLYNQYHNGVRLNVWAKQPKSFFTEAVVDLDGVIAPTNGECKHVLNGKHPKDVVILLRLSLSRKTAQIICCWWTKQRTCLGVRDIWGMVWVRRDLKYSLIIYSSKIKHRLFGLVIP